MCERQREKKRKDDGEKGVSKEAKARLKELKREGRRKGGEVESQEGRWE